MTNQPPLNPDALEAAAAAARIDWSGRTDWNGAPNSIQIEYRNLARAAVAAYLAVSQPVAQKLTDAEWQEFQAIPDQGYSHRAWVDARIAEHVTVAQPEVNSAVEAFINERPGYITTLKNTRGTDDQSDYWRWQGHAESRRQLAQSLGWTVPHNPGEATRPEVKP